MISVGYTTLSLNILFVEISKSNGLSTRFDKDVMNSEEYVVNMLKRLDCKQNDKVVLDDAPSDTEDIVVTKKSTKGDPVSEIDAHLAEVRRRGRPSKARSNASTESAPPSIPVDHAFLLHMMRRDRKIMDNLAARRLKRKINE